MRETKAPTKRWTHINTTYRKIVSPAFANSGQWSQHFSTTYRNIAGRNMLRAFGHHVATCCDMLGIENLTSAHSRGQHCCANQAKRLQQHATSTNVGWKIWPIFKFEPTILNMSQHVAAHRNRMDKRKQHVYFASNNVAIYCVECCDRFTVQSRATNNQTNSYNFKTINWIYS